MAKKKKKIEISKQVYKFQESLVVLALRHLGHAAAKIHWPVETRPAVMSVDVDVLYGRSTEHPEFNISIKHAAVSNDGNATDKAFWRMVRELLETKTAFKKPVRMYNVVFDDSIKPNLTNILESLFDGYLIVHDKSYGSDLIAKCYDYTKRVLATKGDEQSLAFLDDCLKKNSANYDRDLVRLFRAFAKDIGGLVQQRSTGLNTLWKLEREFSQRKYSPPRARASSFKKGLVKLLVFPSEERAKVYKWHKTGTAVEFFPKYLSDLGLVQEGITGFEVVDDDILRVLSGFDSPDQLFESIFAVSPISTIDQKFVLPLRAITNHEAYGQFLIDNFDDISQPKELRRLLEQCFDDPNKLLATYEVHNKESTVWLLNVLIAYIKAGSDTAEKGSIAWLGEQVASKKITPKGFHLPPFVFREKPLETRVLQKIASVLSKEISELGVERLGSLKETSREEFIQSNLEIKLVSNSYFDPIGAYLAIELNRWKIESRRMNLMKTCFAEYVNATKGATSKVLVVDSRTPTIVVWQSPNKNARDKAKEFSARMAGLRLTWNARQSKFEKRGFHVAMIIDGMWKPQDIDGVLKYGCDEVLYPNEIPRFAKTLAGRK